MAPSDHVEKFHDLPEDQMADILPVARKIALALGLVDYNLLQVCSTFLFLLPVVRPPDVPPFLNACTLS